MDIISYILSKKYTDNTVDGLGAIKGAPCTVKSIEDITGGKRITLEWEGTSGTKQTQSFDIMDGEDGANIVEWSQIQQNGTKIAEININGVLTDVYAPTDSSVEPIIRDEIIIPDKYNTGCHGILQKFDVTTDTSGIDWRDGSTIIDFNNGKGVKNLSDNQTIIFENYDFTDYPEFHFLNVSSYTSSSTYYKDNLKIIFKNCLFVKVRQDYEFDSSVNIIFEFHNCTTNRFKVGNAIIDKCLIGNVTFYQELISDYTPNGDTINTVGALDISNSYIMDVEANLSSGSTAHIDGFQVINTGDHDINIYNCRFECFDMPYQYSHGNWAYSLYWQGETINSSIEYCILHGGGVYGVSITKAANQTLENNLISGEYHCVEGAPESEWTKACYPGKNNYQMSDGWADYIRTLLVSSVWIENGKIKICYSNDTHSIKTMRIVTDKNNEYTVTVPACPLRDTASSEGVTQWSDLPFDLVTEINATDVNFIQIYDGDVLVRTFSVNAKIPDAPTTDGTYTLKCAVVSGVPTYSWVAD